jgi:predicted acylesterase/phospholipase RssA
VDYRIWLPLGFVAGWLLMTALTAGFIHLPPRYAAEPIGSGLIDMAGWGNAAARRASIETHIAECKAIEEHVPSAQIAKEIPGSSASPRAIAREWFHPYTPVYAAFTLNFVTIALVSIVIIALPDRFRLFSPAVGIVLLLNIAVFGTILLLVFPPFQVSGNFIVLCLAMLVVLAGRAYKFRFPHMPANTPPLSLEKRYHELILEEAKVTDLASAERAVPETYAVAAGGPTIAPVFSDRIRYPHPHCQSNTKPPLAIVCLSGGGSRAASWAMQVLVSLEERFLRPGLGRPAVALPYHTRLITGASGGMLAGAYYAASLAAPTTQGLVNRNVIPRVAGDPSPITAADLLDGVRQDFLTPVTHTLVNHDLPALFSALRFRYDRGQAFEDALRVAMRGQLHVPLTTLRDGEAAGWRPSLIFSPMLVEDGRQLFISNLDLRKVTQNRAFILGEDDRRSPNDAEGYGLLSREGVEFFKLFPSCVDFTVATAARMSASFPYVMPGVTLRTNPPRRVVDAGYYDNFGVGIAASWLFNHMKWIRDNTSGVVVIQVRDGVSEAGRKREEVFDSFPSLLDRGMQWLTTPPDGLWNSRITSNSFRNDNLLHLLNEFFMAQGFPRGFFATVAFELSDSYDVALNFTLATEEIKAIEAAIDQDAFKDRAESLLNWWHSRLQSPELPLTLAELDRPGTTTA